MKRISYTIKIENPCQENWDEMTDAEKGKHCLSCQKNVIDFSNMNDTELIHFIQNTKQQNICGRFLSSQIERPLLLLQNNYNNVARFNKLYAGLLVLSTAATAYASNSLDQQIPTTQKKQIEFLKGDISIIQDTIVKQDSIQMPASFCGKIINSITKLPVENAVIQLLNSDLKISTNEFGEFKLEIPNVSIDDKMVFSINAPGYNAKQYILNKSELNKVINISIEKYQVKMMGMMIIDEDYQIKKNK